MPRCARTRGLRKRPSWRIKHLGTLARGPPGRRCMHLLYHSLKGEGLASARPGSVICLEQAPGEMEAGANQLGVEEPKLCLQLLPCDPLLFIFSFLDYQDLVSCSYVSQHLNHFSNHDNLWRRHCERYWLLSEAERTQTNKSWKSLFRDMYIDMGRYIAYYAPLKKAWDDLEKFLGQWCPWMITSLNVGVKEQELDAVEAQIGCKLPDDYRCSLRIHNGQKLVVPGLMGSMALFNHYRSETLLDITTAASGFSKRLGLKLCLPLTFCFNTRLSQYMALENIEGHNKYEIFYQCPDQMNPNPSAIEMFISGASYSEWFISYVHNVVTGSYPIIDRQIFKYARDKGCVVRSGDIRVSVYTSFLPELSSILPPNYFFSYQIRIEMSKDALPENSCQLDSKYWRIANAKGEFTELQEEGLVGEFPILTPGRVFEYTSGIIVNTSSVYIEGHLTFHLLYYQDRIFNVEIPSFHIVCPTFKVFTIQRENSLDECSDLEEV